MLSMNTISSRKIYYFQAPPLQMWAWFAVKSIARPENNDMTKPPAHPRVVFMGSPEFSVPSLQALSAHYNVVGVVTQPDRPAGRGQTLTPAAGQSAGPATGSAHHPTTEVAPARSNATAARLETRADRRDRLRANPASGGAGICPPMAVSTCMPRCCRAGAARRRSMQPSCTATRKAV